MKTEWKRVLCLLSISFFGVVGLLCFFVWFSMAAFHEAWQHPIEHPLSVAGGIVSFVAFLFSCVGYAKARSGHWSIGGVLLDLLTVMVSAPLFFWLCSCIYEWLQ